MITTTIRIDEFLYEKIAKISLKEKRSINSQINIILEEYIKIYNYQKRKNSIE